MFIGRNTVYLFLCIPHWQLLLCSCMSSSFASSVMKKETDNFSHDALGHKVAKNIEKSCSSDPENITTESNFSHLANNYGCTKSFNCFKIQLPRSVKGCHLLSCIFSITFSSKYSTHCSYHYQ